MQDIFDDFDFAWLLCVEVNVGMFFMVIFLF